jgi:D-amino-acid oxidase
LSSAGVAGLTTALLLSRKSAYKIVVAAKHMPGDYDIEYASPWAGANYMPYVKHMVSTKDFIKVLYLTHNHSVSISGTDAAEWDKNTWGPLEDLARNNPGAGVHFQGM